MSPEKGGALRNQSTGGRRLGVAAVICSALLAVPLLLLQNVSSAHASHVAMSGETSVIAPTIEVLRRKPPFIGSSSRGSSAGHYTGLAAREVRPDGD